MNIDDKESDSLFGNPLKSIERLIAISGFFAAAGYISLRSHLNYLGVSVSSSLKVDQYLFEVYHFIVSTGERLIYLLLAVIVALIILYFIYFLLNKIIVKSGLAHFQLSSRTIVWMCFLYIFCSFIIITTTCWPKDLHIIVGELTSIVPQDIRIYDIILLSTGVSLVAARKLKNILQKLISDINYSSWKIVILRSALVFVIIQLLILPLFFGIYGHTQTYPHVNIEYGTNSEKKAEGYMVLETASSIVIWKINKEGIGLIEIYNLKEIVKYTIDKSADLLDVVNESFKNSVRISDSNTPSASIHSNASRMMHDILKK